MMSCANVAHSIQIWWNLNENAFHFKKSDTKAYAEKWTKQSKVRKIIIRGMFYARAAQRFDWQSRKEHFVSAYE